MNEWRFNVYREWLHSIWKILPKTRLYCLFFVYVSFGEEKKKTKNTANAALQFCIYNVMENLSIFFLQHFILIFYFTADWLVCMQYLAHLNMTVNIILECSHQKCMCLYINSLNYWLHIYNAWQNFNIPESMGQRIIISL